MLPRAPSSEYWNMKIPSTWHDNIIYL